MDTPARGRDLEKLSNYMTEAPRLEKPIGVSFSRRAELEYSKHVLGSLPVYLVIVSPSKLTINQISFCNACNAIPETGNYVIR